MAPHQLSTSDRDGRSAPATSPGSHAYLADANVTDAVPRSSHHQLLGASRQISGYHLAFTW